MGAAGAIEIIKTCSRTRDRAYSPLISPAPRAFRSSARSKVEGNGWKSAVGGCKARGTSGSPPSVCPRPVYWPAPCRDTRTCLRAAFSSSGRPHRIIEQTRSDIYASRSFGTGARCLPVRANVNSADLPVGLPPGSVVKRKALARVKSVRG